MADDGHDLPAVNEVDFAYSLAVGAYNKYDERDVEAAARVLRSGRLFYPIGSEVQALEQRIAAEYGVPGCTLVSSGTAAVHTGLGALNVDFGDEVVCPPLADTGTVIPVLLQGAVPVFADVEPTTLMVTAATIEAVLTDRTRAIIVVHLGGFAADMDPILELARERGIAVLEDCAQAPATYYNGRRAGTMGDVGTFSVNDTKHVSCGDGGYVISRRRDIADRAQLFHDKGFDRRSRIRNPVLVGPNYRMTELQAAVLAEQWPRLESRVAARASFASEVDATLEDTVGLEPATTHPGSRSSHFSYFIRVGPDASMSRDELAASLCASGVPARRGNLYDPLYRLRIFHDALPRFLDHLTHPSYEDGACPGAEHAHATTVRLEMLETFGEREVAALNHVIRRRTVAVA